MKNGCLDHRVSSIDVEQYRVRDEPEVGVQFASRIELERAGEFLNKERLPFSQYGNRVFGVYKAVRDYLTANGFRFGDFEIIHTRYLSPTELKRLGR